MELSRFIKDKKQLLVKRKDHQRAINLCPGTDKIIYFQSESAKESLLIVSNQLPANQSRHFFSLTKLTAAGVSSLRVHCHVSRFCGTRLIMQLYLTDCNTVTKSRRLQQTIGSRIWNKTIQTSFYIILLPLRVVEVRTCVPYNFPTDE